MGNLESKSNERPQILGVLNVTPDSFSDGGRFNSLELAVQRGELMFAEGADIIDVGGESTRPGADEVSVDVELQRVVPVVERLSKVGHVSVDTQKAEVAYQAVAAGASVINDVSAELWPVAAELQVGWIAMHKRGKPKNMQQSPEYHNVLGQVLDFLVARAERAESAGVPKVWIDPGFGFGKTLNHNLALLANLDLFTATRWDVVVGISRKSMLGQLIAFSEGSDDLAPEEDRLEGSLLSATYAMLKGAKMVRVHDVQATREARTIIYRE